MRHANRVLMSMLMGCDTSTPEPDLIACDGTLCFSIEDFGDSMAATLGPNTVGWSYVIYYNGEAEKWGEGGEWRTQVDPPQLNANIYDGFNMGSIGKTITTLGAVVALDQTPLGVDEKIVGWLPTQWSVGPGVDQITFRDLMTHESGFRTDGCTDSDLQQVVKGGINSSDYGQGSYLSASFCLMRVLIPEIVGTAPASGDAIETANADVDWIQQSVFTPAGLSLIEPTACTTV